MLGLKFKRFLEKKFFFHEHHTTIKTEVIAGLTTFATLAYALLLIPSLLAEGGMPFGPAMTATLITAAFATFLMGLSANYPFALAPGVAMSAYFSYSLLQQGTDWHLGLGIIFWCGVLLLFLTLTGIRKRIVLAIPAPIRLGVAAGLGFFLVLIGLKEAGIVVSHPSNFVALGNTQDPFVFLSAIGILIIACLLVWRFPAAFILGILILWAIGVIFGYSPFKGIISMPSSLRETFLSLDVRGVFHTRWINPFLSFFLVILFDTSGTLLGLAEEGRFLRASKKESKGETLPRITRALLPDSFGTTLGGCLGTTSTALYLESAAGLAVGGRTGLTAVVVGFLFLLGLFFTPFASSIPVFATSPVLILVGAMMLRQLGRLQWDDAAEWISGTVTFILIPFTFSVVGGVAVGMILYPLLKLVSGKWREVSFMTWGLGLFFLLKFIFLPSL